MPYPDYNYSSLIKGAYYQGIDNGRPDDNGNFSREIPFVGKFLGVRDDLMLVVHNNPESRAARQVGLLCNDPKYGRCWRFFDPETLTLIENPTDDQLVED